MRKLIAVIAALAVGLALAVAGQAKKAPPALKGEVGPGFSIEVTKGKSDLETTKHGTYTIKV